MKNKGNKQKKLTPRQQKFVALYLGCLNASKAAREAGFSPIAADKKAPMWVGKSREACPEGYRHVWDAVRIGIEEKGKQIEASTDRFLKELCLLAFMDPVSAFKEKSLVLKTLDEIPEEVRRCIQSIAPVKGGGFKVTFYDKTKALNMIGQYLGAFIQKHEVSGPNGRPISTESTSKIDLSKLSTDELIQLRQILARGKSEPDRTADDN